MRQERHDLKPLQCHDAEMKTKTKERENQANKRQKLWREEGGQEKEEKIEE